MMKGWFIDIATRLKTCSLHVVENKLHIYFNTLRAVYPHCDGRFFIVVWQKPDKEMTGISGGTPLIKEVMFLYQHANGIIAHFAFALCNKCIRHYPNSFSFVFKQSNSEKLFTNWAWSVQWTLLDWRLHNTKSRTKLWSLCSHSKSCLGVSKSGFYQASLAPWEGGRNYGWRGANLRPFLWALLSPYVSPDALKV